ncbi:MAG: MoaD/ThiS family protein [Desulfarculus sp.]|nr:MAG: MoaD/ThiS family protein [Desulfarculus sp.]
MAVKVEIFSSLRQYVAAYDPARGLAWPGAGRSVAQLAAELGIPAGEVKLAMVNRAPAPLERRLADGDLVGLFPLVDGG